ncbi:MULTISPECIES: murein hydrolase activator EnvC family protein [Paenibacillus]|uniref:Peptidoglycan DD-metalloendopeptidase family protein n=1 Tax=Paenibacillus alvei TaxID=44250 RepID=A0ABT4E8D0_PAEAL|nr:MULTISPECIES: peptidoglycan DD-metalloendopeptidase family protein [Paenibacillus]EPY09469.1 peptidase M23 [Paenibacillus alvei A6-6i-x]MCY9528621.1 peptidoglycan DD-metalloendopeptidase family protein [Paenibacillus alvei]SDG22880.1 Murein DD-endopeptidase MepM and murein hydrolase activator NlpD, contain LysM domain [Paenibacillus sp. cl6col]
MKRSTGLKKWITLFASFAIVFSMAPPSTGQASELDKVNQQLKQLQSEMRQAENKQQEAKSMKAEATKLLGKTQKDMDYLLSEIDKKANEMANVAHQIDETELNLAEAADELQKVNKRIDEREDLLDTRVRLMYTNGVVSYIDVLFSATSFSDFLDRFDSLQSIAEQDKEILAEHKRDKQLVVQKKQEIETNLKQVKLLYAKLDNAKKDLMLKEKEKEVMIASYNKQIDESDDASEEQDRLLVEFAKKRAELLRKKNELMKPKEKPKPKAKPRSSSNPSSSAYSGGKFAVPLHDDYYISSRFGSRTDPITGKQGAFHSGLDMATPGGTDIYAAESGTVLIAEWWSGYGNCVVIDHGNGVWSLYGHIRNGGIKVSKGDQVSRGDKIAEVGATGRATGNHLHFEVRVDGERVDPEPYLK